MTIETVKVKKNSDKGYKIINKSDFDPDVHELFDAEITPAEEVDQPAKRGRKPKGE
jgi:hypothetical protein